MATPRKKSTRRAPQSATRPSGKAPSSEQASGEKRVGGKRKAAAAASKQARSAGPASPDDMPAEVIEFLTAIDDYKRKNARPFPSWSEILEVLKGLGYRKAG